MTAGSQNPVHTLFQISIFVYKWPFIFKYAILTQSYFFIRNFQTYSNCNLHTDSIKYTVKSDAIKLSDN
jgi:hypothetical protein